LLHHYKFYLSIKNSIDEDYVTEKLYQGLRAGSVPIYLGAPNVRDYLPHPDSALLIEDFDNVEDLIEYVSLASEDEQLYSKHMAWKSREFPATFMNKVATKPMDSIFCKTCDLIATQYGDGFGPIAGGKGDGLLLPWCVVRSLNANSESKWHQQNTFTQSEFYLHTYVLFGQLNGSSRILSPQIRTNLVSGYEENVLDTDVM